MSDPVRRGDVKGEPRKWTIWVCPRCNAIQRGPGRHYGGRESWAQPEWCYPAEQVGQYYVDDAVYADFEVVEVVELTPGRTAEDGGSKKSPRPSQNLEAAREPARAIRDEGFSDEDVEAGARALMRHWSDGRRAVSLRLGPANAPTAARLVLEAVFSRSPVGEEER